MDAGMSGVEGAPAVPALPGGETQTVSAEGGALTRPEKPARKRPSLVVMALCAAVLLVGVYVAVTAFVMSQEGEGEKASLTSSAESVDGAGASAHEVCTNQVFAVAAHLYDDRGSWGFEAEVNGQADPHFQQGIIVQQFIAGDVLRAGADVAAENARERAGEACTSVLDDAERPNYPTDGTYLER